MKIKKPILASILIIGLALSFHFSYLQQRNKHQILFLKDEDFILKERIKSLVSLRREEINLDNIYNFSDTVYESIKARVKNGTSKVFVLMIPENHCSDCLDKEYKRLKELPIGIQNNIIILTNFKKNRDTRVFLSLKKLEYPIYNSYAKAQGRAEGEAKGKAEGEAKGEIKGKAEGHESAMETVIINGSKNGLTLEQLQSVTGWEKDKITEVLKRNHLL